MELQKWNIEINSNKTEGIIFHYGSDQLIHKPTYDNTDIVWKSQAEYLGTILEKRLTWLQKNKYMKSKANIELNKLGIPTDQSKIQTRHKSQNITLQNNHKAHHIRSTDMETILNFTDKTKTSDNTHILTLGQ